jgi:class 3 adenylate cyclase/CHASE2 domain-containing sensor protein
MTAPERRQLRRNLLLGGLLTALLVGCTAAGLFEPLEAWLYDIRSRHCQWYTPPPTTQLVHLDIDDVSLELIGHWPWPRHLMAVILEEVHRAGAKALALDVLYMDRPAENVSQQVASAGSLPATAPASPAATAGSAALRNDEQLLADTLARFPAFVVPISFGFKTKMSLPAWKMRLAEELAKDLELSLEEAEKRVGQPVPQDAFLDALDSAAAARIRAEKGAEDLSFDQLQARLLPKSLAMFGAGKTVQARVLEKQFGIFQATAAIRHLERPREPGLPSLLEAAGDQPSLPELSRVAEAAGFVTFIAAPDGIVRSIPLWAEHHDRLVPQFALALACAYLDVDIKAIRLSPGAAELPRPGQPPIVIPLRTERSPRLGEMAMFVDIPYFGRPGNWESMYDYPKRRDPVQHVPMGFVWEAVQIRERIRVNNRTADEALIEVLEFYAPERIPELKAKPLALDDVDGRLAMIRDVLADDFAKAAWDTFRRMPEAEVAALKPGERRTRDEFLAAWNVLPLLADQNRTFALLLRAREGELRQQFAGKAVIVGPTATAMGDLRPTSLHAQCPGPVIHGTLFNAIVTNYFRTRAPESVTLEITAFMGVLCTLLVSWMPARRAMVWTAGLILAYLAFNGWFLFDRQRLIVGAAGPLAAGVGVWTALSLVRYITETAERNRVTRRFRSYTDPALVAYVLEHPEQEFLPSQRREMTVVFTDLEGFTTLTEQLREGAVAILSRFMSRMVPIIRRHRGLVNKFMGDGIMFFFGAPEKNERHAADAVTTVLEMQQEIERLNEELRAQGSPTLRLRAGVTTGPMIVGDAGDATRSDYTVLGDAVNLSARLESANKAFGTRMLVSERTVEEAGERFLFRPVGRIRVAGKTEGVMAYEPVCAAEVATEEERQLVRSCQEVIDCFAGSRFGDCLDALERLEQADGRALGKWCGVLRDLCQSYIASPPGEFDRTIVLKEK